MSKISNVVRIIPQASDFLDRKLGARGEVFYDQATNTLRLYNGAQIGGFELARSDLSNISNANFTAKATAAGVGSASLSNLNASNLTSGTVPVTRLGSAGIRDATTYLRGDNTWTAVAGGSGTVQSGLSGKIAYYPSAGTQVDDLAALSWDSAAVKLSLTGIIDITGQKNRIRFHWDTLADLETEVSPVNYHGMVAHVHDTGKLYYAHNGAWVPVAAESSLPNTFSTVAVAGQSNVIADSTADTLTLVAGSNITITTNASTDTITITSTAPAGPAGPAGPTGASGSGSGDVVSTGGGYVDNAIIRYDGTTGTIIQNSSATISDDGLLTATNFSGGGAALTALNATQLTSGTIPDARFPATLPAVSGANLTALPATLPVASGTNLTSLNATQLTSGTVPVLRLGASGTRDATTYLRGDNTWATVTGNSASDSFVTIAVAGQSSVVADSSTDTLTLVAGSNITITTNASTDTITIAAAGGGSASDSFSTISVAGQSNVVADSATDTLTIAAGTGISITTDAGTDTVTITSTVSAGATAFTGLSDISATSLTVDKIYLPAITMLTVTNNGASAYRFDQYGTTDDPTIFAINATTIAFNLQVSGHPFLIQDNTGTNYNTGLTHVTTGGVVSTGASAQGQTSGTLYWKIPDVISGNYRYQCSAHAAMVGTITVKNFGSI